MSLCLIARAHFVYTGKDFLHTDKKEISAKNVAGDLIALPNLQDSSFLDTGQPPPLPGLFKVTMAMGIGMVTVNDIGGDARGYGGCYGVNLKYKYDHMQACCWTWENPALDFLGLDVECGMHIPHPSPKHIVDLIFLSSKCKKNRIEEEFLQNNYLIWSRKGIGLRRFEFWMSCPDLRFSSEVTSFPRPQMQIVS